MNCIGHIFDERPTVVTVPEWRAGRTGRVEIGYTAPPFGSKIVREAHHNAFAYAPDGFEWVLLFDHPVWVPTGSHKGYPSIEDSRNFRMGTNEDTF